MEPRPLFIVVDGLDGCGKTTLVDGICKELWGQDVPHFRTMEPSLSKVGVFIRNLLHSTEQQQSFEEKSLLKNSDAMSCLFAADRSIHMRAVQLELDARKHVVCDRWLLSSLVYQCGCEKANDPRLRQRFSAVLTVNRAATEFLQPDLHVFVRVPSSVAHERISKTRGRWGRTFFEGEERLKRDAELWDAAVDYYVKVFGRPVLIVDGEMKPNELVAGVFRELRRDHEWFPRLPKGSEP